jgi:2-polyprenyl-3-methyl-5-hydroxy-6-metoxy-1,4-benzoquinol methylase
MTPTNPDNITTSDYWNRVYSEEWERGVATSGNYSRDYGPIHDAIIGLIPDGSQVLDIACGPGLLCRKIRERRPGSHVTGVDFSGYTIEQIRARDRSLGIDYRVLDVRRELRTLEERFNVVTMCEILEHLDDPQAVVADAMELLKPGGRFILSCPHGNEIPDPEHVREWDHDELSHLLAHYANTVSFTHFPPPYFHIWMLAHLDKDSPGSPSNKP